MVEQLATYSAAAAIEAGVSYWLKLLQVGKLDDIATVGDAAKVLDAVYDIDVCIDPGAKTGGEDAPTDEDGELEEPMSEEAFWAKVQELLELNICDEDDSREATLQVYRSHLGEPYTLLLDNGTEQATLVKTERKKQTIAVGGVSFVDTAFPVGGNFVYQWQSCNSVQGPILPVAVTVSGSRLSFGREIIGVLLVQYDSEFDEVTIKIPNESDGHPGTCHVRALYHGAQYETDLTLPDVEDDEITTRAKTLVCGGSGGGIDLLKNPYCYDLVYYMYRCMCSNKVNTERSFYTENQVSCPAGLDEDGRFLMDTYTVLQGYVDCNEGEVTQEDRDNYEAICCEPGDPPACEKIYALFQGGNGYGPGIEYAKIAYGENVILVPVGPKNGPCGTWLTEFIKPGKNCCDEVDPIAINAAGTDWTIGLPGSATLAATGGEPPYTWQANGGYVFANGLDMDVTYSYPPVNVLYTNDDKVCSDAAVVLSDACSSVMFAIDQTAEELEPVLPDNLVVAPDTQTLVELENSSVGPYLWTASGELSWLYSETLLPVNVLISSPDFCGSAGVSVSDACTNSDSAMVRSTDGAWVAYPFDDCSCAVSSGDIEWRYSAGGPAVTCFPQHALVTNGDQRCLYSIESHVAGGWSGTCNPDGGGIGPYDCYPPGPFPQLAEKHCSDYSPGDCGGPYNTGYTGGCCVGYGLGGVGVNLYLNYSTRVGGYWKWECITP